MDTVTGAVMSSRTLDLGRGHAEKMIDVIGGVFEDAGGNYASLTGLSVCVGPGSFTGIRVVLATATGLSIALGIPVIGVTALQASALQALPIAGGKPILSLIDAHRGDVYIQSFSADALPVGHPCQIPLQEAAALASAGSYFLCGSVTPMVTGQPAADELLPSVNSVALAALNPAMTVPAKPLYLRKPDAKPQESYTQARAMRQ
jgi:tRNA threonylcarbamoyladenosine biosynthesis protein TsaB